MMNEDTTVNDVETDIDDDNDDTDENFYE